MTGKLKPASPEAAAAPPVPFPIFDRPVPRPPRRLSRSSSTGAAVAHGSTGSFTGPVTPEQRANTTRDNPMPTEDALSRALMFTVCNETATSFDQAFVNWIPGPAGANLSYLQYQLCAAASLQPRLVSSFGLVNLDNSLGSKKFVARVNICGRQSAGQVSCSNRVSALRPCLTGITSVPVAFDPAATRTTLTVGTLPPATSTIRMCL